METAGRHGRTRNETSLAEAVRPHDPVHMAAEPGEEIPDEDHIVRSMN